ncbi:MAG: hypothetical protein B7Z15_07975 [Rhizobiales bacterium 32-66-8]|nr:MAG: hypothetical protein B7Z15_07975 [Rhizobiales bacterium 32-66-8]
MFLRPAASDADPARGGHPNQPPGSLRAAVSFLMQAESRPGAFPAPRREGVPPVSRSASRSPNRIAPVPSSALRRAGATLLAGALALMVPVTGAMAQSTPQSTPKSTPQPQFSPPPPPGQQPQRTSSTYDDWELRCETLVTPAPRKVCEIVQFTRVQGQQQPLTQLAIARPEATQAWRLVAQVPAGVSLPKGIRLVLEEKGPAVDLTYRRCMGDACFAEVELKDDVVAKLKARTTGATLVFANGADHDITVPVSFTGFAPDGVPHAAGIAPAVL